MLYIDGTTSLDETSVMEMAVNTVPCLVEGANLDITVLRQGLTSPAKNTGAEDQNMTDVVVANALTKLCATVANSPTTASKASETRLLAAINMVIVPKAATAVTRA